MKIKYSSDTMDFTIITYDNYLKLKMNRQPDNIPFYSKGYPNGQWDVGGDGLCFLSRGSVNITKILDDSRKRAIFLIGRSSSAVTHKISCYSRNSMCVYASQLYRGLVRLDKFMEVINNT